MWFPWSNSIKTRLCRFLLHHYIGHYLEEKLSLDQMSIELYAGKGTILNVGLNTESLNDLLDQLNLPFEITEGFIGRVSIGVPWQTLVSNSTVVEVEGLEITVQPKQTSPTATTSMMDSVRNMTSSLVLAQHVMEEEVDTKLEGLEAFAHMIESVLSRVKCSFRNTSICLQSRDTSLSVKLQLVVDTINYFDEGEKEEVGSETEAHFIPTSIAHKVILLSGISLRAAETHHLFNCFNDPEREEQAAPQPNVVAKFLGEQEIKIHLKINDQLPGPKLDMECNVGSIHAMLTPHTVHLLSDLIQSINTTLTDSRKERVPMRCHKMDNDDFAKVEHQLHSTLSKPQGNSLLPVDEFGSDFFYSMNTVQGQFPSLDLPPLDTEMQSIPLGSLTDNTAPGLSEGFKKLPKSASKNTELMEDQIVVQLNVRYIAVTLLHQNLTHASVKGDLTPPQVVLSHNYFSEIAEVVTNNYVNDAANIRAVLNKVCPHDHMFMNCVNTTFRLELMTSTQHIDSSTTLSVVKCEVEEALYSSLTETNMKSPNIQPVILLNQQETQAMTGSIYHPTNPALNFTSKCVSSSEEHNTSCSLELGSVSLIADITMLERVGVFRKASSKRSVHLPTAPGQDLHLPSASMVRQNIYEQVIGESCWDADKVYQEIFKSTVTCCAISVTFRFPIPDMRPAAQRTWWVPSLRADYVVMHVDQASLMYNKQPAVSEIGADFTKLNCEYMEHSDSDPISFLQAGLLEDDPTTRPHITITLTPATDSSLLAEHHPSSPPPLSLDSILHIPESEPSPFARKRVMYESQELIMPGSKDEMSAFEDQVKEHCKVSLHFSLPEVLIYLQDKHFFEVLYNRLLTDLLLWTPACPVVQENSLRVEPDVFKMCTSTAHRESDSESEEDMTAVPTYRVSQKRSGTSSLSLSFDIQQTRISLNCTVPPTPEQSPLHVNPTGEVLLELIQTHIFTVLEHEGDPNSSYFSMHSDTGTLYHGTNSGVSMSTSTDSSLHSSLDEILFALPAHLAQFLPPRNPDYGLLTIASKMFFDQSKNIKEITLALALHGVCHRYYMKHPEENFALQLIEFFNVEDYTVPGYKLPLSVTSLHTHLWNLAVDYRPLYLPWNLLATIQSLGISSNLALESAVTSLRVLLEDFTLHLAPEQALQSLNRDGYVKLVELDLFELVIKVLIACDEKSPQLDIEIKNNMLHVGTCADSCAALRDFLIYCCSEGDLNEPCDIAQSSSDHFKNTRIREHSSSSDIPSLVKSAVNASSSDLTSLAKPPIHASSSDLTSLAKPPIHASSSDLTSPAKPAVITSSSKLSAPDVEPTAHDPPDHVTTAYSKQTFTFPDDSPTVETAAVTVKDIATAADDDSEDLPMSVKTLYSVSDAMLSAMEEEDQEFFVVESELVETMVPKGQFVIKKLVDRTPLLVEDHFALPEDTDLLKAPSHFPLPLSRITVKELSLQWSMFGGNDFPLPSENSSLPGTPRSERAHSLSDTSNRERKNSQKSSKDTSGRIISEQMDFLVTKMKMRFEQYPQSAHQIFRVCLILTDLEIRDKMGSSNFNKFLYQYSTDDNPRPFRTPMFCVKAVHNRSDEPTEEAIIRVSILPLRFNIDQDALLFIFTFFNNMSEMAPYRRPARAPTTAPCAASTTRALHEEPLGFGKSSAVVSKKTVCAGNVTPRVTSPMTVPNRERSQSLTASITSTIGAATSTIETAASLTADCARCTPSPDHQEAPTFIKAFVFSPDVPIRVDYRGKNVRGDTNMVSNPLTNLLIGLAQLNCSELRLKSLCYRQGLLGYPRLAEWVTLQWINDIKTSQLPSILGGVGPMHSFIQLFSGLVDLVYLPVQQYREDGRIVKGLQRGANSFTHSTAVSLLQLTSKLFSSIQCVAEVTYDLVSPSQHRKSSPSFQQPADLREGLVNAYQLVTSDISTRASCIQHAAVYNHSTKGITSAVGGVLREIPPTLLLPFITLPKVITQLSNGAQNHLKPSTLKEREEKYRS